MSRGAGTEAAVRTVGDAMLRHPTVHRADLTFGEARAAFEASPKRHLLLLVDAGRLVGTLTRHDVAEPLPAPARAPLGLLAGRVVGPEEPLAAVHDRMMREERRRLAVVDDSMRLLGLLCLKRSRSGFCTDHGVAAMRAARRGTTSGRLLVG